MTVMRRLTPRALTLVLAVASALLAAAAGIPETLRPDEVLNYRKAGAALATAGKPSPETLAKLKGLGFRTAIDLRQPSEGVAAAREAVEEQGLTFVSVPVSPETFRLDDAKKVAAILSDTKAAPVLLYCSSSNRVGAMIAVVEALGGRPHDEAIAEGRKAGLKSPPMIEAVERVLAEK